MSESILIRLLDLDALSHLMRQAHLCPLQDPFRIQARYLGWKVATLLIDEAGELKKEELKILIDALSKASYTLEGDRWIYMHVLSSLKLLEEKESLWRALKKCSLPLANKTVQNFVRDTLWPHEIGSIRTADVHRAALTAWLTLLRQTTGSCFATAPAIWIQKHDPLLFFQDLESILFAGELRRSGTMAPSCLSMGLGEWHHPFRELSANASPGLRAAFHAAGLTMPATLKSAPKESPESIFSKHLFEHFGLTPKDLSTEAASLAPHFAVLWEKTGGRLAAPSKKSLQIDEMKKAKEKGQRAFSALADCPLLRCWEYTIASFCDVRVEVSRRNVYIGLGLHPDQGGLGQFLFRIIDQKWKEANQRFSELHEERRRFIQIAQAAERLLQSGETSYEVQAEYQGAVHSANQAAEQIEETASLADWLAKLFQLTFDAAIEKLSHFFQEVFDPALGEAGIGLFEDSPAGFRLICKYDRSASSSWERIETSAQFVEAACRFLEAIEREMNVEPKRKEAWAALMTETVQYVRSAEFIEGAMMRAQRENRSTPWAYISGGTIQTLLRNYLEVEPKEFGRPIQSEKELLNFLILAAKQAEGRETLLMSSPTHAFVFHPFWLQIDHDPERMHRFVKQLDITAEKADFLAEEFSKWVPDLHRPLFAHRWAQSETPRELTSLRKNLLESSNLSEEMVDSFLYESLPVFSSSEAKRAFELLKEALFSQSQEVFAMGSLEDRARFLTSKQLLAAAKSQKKRFFQTDWEKEIAEEARRQGLLPPGPILFGDTNWSHWCFGFVHNMVTNQLELWRLDRLGVSGVPMNEWKVHFRSAGRWTVFL